MFAREKKRKKERESEKDISKTSEDEKVDRPCCVIACEEARRLSRVVNYLQTIVELGWTYVLHFPLGIANVEPMNNFSAEFTESAEESDALHLSNMCAYVYMYGSRRSLSFSFFFFPLLLSLSSFFLEFDGTSQQNYRITWQRKDSWHRILRKYVHCANLSFKDLEGAVRGA